jgi:hypothetical protein
LFSFLAAVLVILIALITLLMLFPRSQVKRYVQNRLARLLNGQVEIYTFTIDYIPATKFVMEQVIVTDPETSRRVLTIREAVVYIDPWNYIRGVNPITRVVLGTPTLAVWKTETGNWNLQGMVVQQKEQEQREQGAQEQARLPIVIRNGTIQISRQKTQKLVAIKNIFATIRLKKNQILVEKASLIYPPVYADFDGTISEFSSPNPVMDLKASGKVLKEGTLADIGGYRVKDYAQLAGFSLTTSGPTNNMNIVSTFSTDKKLTFEIPAQGSLKGLLHLDQAVLDVQDFTTQLNDSRLSMSGKATNLWSDERAAELSGTADILLEQFIAAVSQPVATRIEPDGAAQGKISIVATMGKIDLTAEMNLEKAGFTVPKVMRKDIGIPGSLSMNARYLVGQALFIDKFDLTVKDSTVSGKGGFNPHGEPWMLISLQTKDFSLPQLNRVPAVEFQKGGLTLDGEIRQSAPNAAGLNYKADVKIEKAQLKAEPVRAPIEQLNAKLNVVNEDVKVENAEFVFTGSDFSLNGNLTNFSAPSIEGTLRADRLDLQRLREALSKEERQGEEQRYTVLPPIISIRMLVEADSVYTGRFLTGPVSGTFQTAGGTYTFAPFSLKLFSGQVVGNSEFTPNEQQMTWNVNFKANDINLEDMLKELQIGEGKLTGTLNSTARLQGMVSGATKELLQSVKGEAEATSSGGEVRNLPVLTTIINLTQVPLGTAIIPGLREIIIANTVLNLFKTAGRSLNVTVVAYNTIEGTFQLTDGVANTGNLHFNSGLIDLLCNGKYDYVNGDIDFKVSATPLGALSSVVREIPLAGIPFKGAEQTVLATQFFVTGTISNPEVRPAILENVLPWERLKSLEPQKQQKEEKASKEEKRFEDRRRKKMGLP